MSNYVHKARGAYELEHGTVAPMDFVEHVLWPSSGFEAVARPVGELIAEASVGAGVPIRGVVVSGARRREELDWIASLGQPTLLVYLVVPFITRFERSGRKCEGPPQGRLALFEGRNDREQDWGLLGEPVDHSFLLVRNDGPLPHALAEIEELARRRLLRRE